jgi:FAD/FMN-containing dehydrogenase
MHGFLVISIVSFLVNVNAYCQPSLPCWPSPAEWATFNTTVNGRLLTILPEGFPCFNGSTSSPACQAVINNWTNPYWRAAQPGAMQAPNWEADANGNNCFTPDTPCSQGSIPTVGVAVQDPSDISAALAFAEKYDIQVAVKSTGHDFQGRSTAPNALLLWLHTLQGISINTSYAACPQQAPAPAVTTHPGDAWGAVYDAVLPNYGVVGGSARTVSSAGGYTLGGGHSFMSPSCGLAVDNVLAMQAVLANGTIVTASECTNPDLFWGLRGGGGGTFAVVTSVTYRLHPTPPAGVTGLTLVVAFLQGTTSAAVFLDGFMAATPGLLSPATTGGVWAGYTQLNISGSYMSMTLVYNGTEDAAAASLQPLMAFLNDTTSYLYVVASKLQPYTSMFAWHDVIDPADNTGVSLTLGSRLIPASACNASNRDAAISAILTVAANTTLSLYLVAGGAVGAYDRNSTLTSVTPAWRDAVYHAVGGAGWSTGTPIAEQAALFQAVTELTGVLRAAFPDSGAYWSESDVLEPNWQQSFWGLPNYARLQSMKATYDPTGVFGCYHCVELPSGV